MGIGDYICVTISGGAPWGFRLQGGKEHKLPLQISKVRKKSKACRAGLCEGDEMISINGKPCSELTHSEAMQLIDGTSENLQILIKRPISEKADQPEYEDYEGTKRQETVESRMQVSDSKTSCKHGLPFELYISESQDEAYYGETESDTDVTGKKEGNQRQNVSSLLLKECTPSGESRQDPKWKEKRGAQHTAMVELQLSLTQGKLGDPETTAVTVIGAEKIPSAAREPTTLYESIQKTESAASETNGNVTTQTASATISHQNRSDKKVKLVESELQGTEADSYQSRVELSLDSSDREHSGREASTSEVGSACADSLAEDGQSKTRSNPPFLVGISSEGTEPGSEGTRSGKDSTRTHKHRARQAKIRRSESLSEKQVKEAKSKCKSIALLLTATPTPSSKGALMFKKRRQRAKKYTLVSYGTGEFDPDDDQEDSIEFALVPTSDSDLDEDFCADVNSAQVVTFDWDTGLVEVEKKEKTEDEMQRLPESKGKGALLFAKRKQRIDQFTAEQEEMRRTGANEAASTHTVETENLYQTTKSSLYDSSNTIQNHATENYIDVSKLHGTENVRGGKARSEMVIQNSKSAETNRAGAMNRTAIPFPGVQNRAAAPFSPTRNVANSLSNVPPPPPYSSISPPPDNIHRIASPPLASVAQPAKWSPMGIAGEQIASRDERICVPAIKTGILQDARKRNTTKPMFTFVDRPKVAPNPELLSMVKGKTDRRRGVDQPGGGFESGPEEDYLSLGAEASNFLQTPAVKQKKPPPVAPKPFVKSPPTGPNPTLPPLSPPGVTSAQAPVHSSKSAKQMSVKLHSVQPVNTWYQSQGSANQFVSSTGPQSVTSTHSYPSKMPPTTPIANSAPAGGMGPAYEMPALKGKGAQLFARRQSRMEKYVVDSSTVKARQARSSSPTPSMPASWKYSSNIRAPPPLAYNPIHSPSYPPGILKAHAQSASSSKPNKGAKVKGTKKPLNALDVMKHQPYQLNSSLFTFSSTPDAKTPLSTSSSLSKQSIKSDPVPLQPVNATYPISKSVSSVSTGPSFNQANTASADEEHIYSSGKNVFVPPSYASYPKQESSALSVAMAPRPKFSAKKVGVTAQAQSKGFQPVQVPEKQSQYNYSHGLSGAQAMKQPGTPLSGRPASQSEKIAKKKLTPWDAASQSAVGSVEEAFSRRNIQESIAKNIVSAARRKTLPEPPEEWKARVAYVPPLPSGYSSIAAFQVRRPSSISSSVKTTASIPTSISQQSSMYKQPLNYQQSLTDSDLSTGTCSEHETSGKQVADPNYNPYPRGWKKQR
ncbi:synaptopodin-2-like isoform X1 [Hemiscyllium ocellatum]|uniref:synaptopodin-2-like isoform X1 n=1 Tax=Hemiscyllium ocellatum TaxID=170820 RepID=UPI00296642E2|nr:synaptopodin-2-like isoform X1 [Hemiscyllium ocellatum]